MYKGSPLGRANVSVKLRRSVFRKPKRRKKSATLDQLSIKRKERSEELKNNS
jgi:hypothetical protein